MVASKQGLVNVLSNYIHVGCENLTYATWYDHKVGQTKFTVYRHKDFYFECGRAVIIQISNQYRVLVSYAWTSKLPRPRPLIRVLGGWGSKCCMFTVLNLKYEIFLRKSENPCRRVVTINSEFSLPSLSSHTQKNRSFHNWSIIQVRCRARIIPRLRDNQSRILRHFYTVHRPGVGNWRGACTYRAVQRHGRSLLDANITAWRYNSTIIGKKDITSCSSSAVGNHWSITWMGGNNNCYVII